MTWMIVGVIALIGIGIVCLGVKGLRDNLEEGVVISVSGLVLLGGIIAMALRG